ncbi:MAG: hypothetical protein AAFO29_13520, partial [Actinomycetota bacterium]
MPATMGSNRTPDRRKRPAPRTAQGAAAVVALLCLLAGCGSSQVESEADVAATDTQDTDTGAAEAEEADDLGSSLVDRYGDQVDNIDQ